MMATLAGIYVLQDFVKFQSQMKLKFVSVCVEGAEKWSGRLLILQVESMYWCYMSRTKSMCDGI